MRVLIVHGYNGVPNDHWRPWLKDELEKKGFEVFLPAMPTPEAPKEEEWVSKIHEVIDTPGDDLIIIGHSLGCIASLRYLESLKEDEKVRGLVLVAGFSDRLETSALSNFFSKEIEWEKIKSHCDNFVAIHSDNDPHVQIEHGHIFEEKLGAKFIFEPGKGHFMKSDGVTELPSALNSILEISEY